MSPVRLAVDAAGGDSGVEVGGEVRARLQDVADVDAEQVLGFVAVVFGTINIVGGFLVTDRMLEMFKQRRPDGDDEGR